MWADRDRVEARLHALIADFIDARAEDNDREFDLGVFALVAEVRERRTADEIEGMLSELGRPEAEYTPEVEWAESSWYRCSDSREWIAAGLFRRAMLIADGFYDHEGEEDGEGNREPEA